MTIVLIAGLPAFSEICFKRDNVKKSLFCFLLRSLCINFAKILTK